MPKRIVVCCDGTWSTPDERDVNPANPPEYALAPTNVTKLALAVAPSDPQNGISQLVFYNRGVGTGNWGHILGGVLGAGLDRKIQEAYTYIVENYESGDELYLFGFSRGAYTVRSLAGFIRNSGVLQPRNASRLDAAFALYRDRSPASHPRTLESQLFRRSFSYEPRIKFMGVWDTVGSLGIPNAPFPIAKHWMFHDLVLSSYVENAFQALAIDERRGPFSPALFARDQHDAQRLEQVWFAGVHKDVGGGYFAHTLSDLSLAWMARRA